MGLSSTGFGVAATFACSRGQTAKPRRAEAPLPVTPSRVRNPETRVKLLGVGQTRVLRSNRKQPRSGNWSDTPRPESRLRPLTVGRATVCLRPAARSGPRAAANGSAWPRCDQLADSDNRRAQLRWALRCSASSRLQHTQLQPPRRTTTRSRWLSRTRLVIMGLGHCRTPLTAAHPYPQAMASAAAFSRARYSARRMR